MRAASVWAVVVAMVVAGPASAARPLPTEVQTYVDGLLKECAEKRMKPNFEKGFLQRRDINGDGVDDFVLDMGHFQCGSEGHLYCGSAGCLTTVFASRQGQYTKVLDENVQQLKFMSRGGQPVMQLFMHGSSCGKPGFEVCTIDLYWNGERFSPAH